MVVRVHPAQKWGISPEVGVFGWKKSFGIFSLISFSSYGGRFLYSVGGSGVVCDDSAGAHVYGRRVEWCLVCAVYCFLLRVATERSHYVRLSCMAAAVSPALSRRTPLMRRRGR